MMLAPTTLIGVSGSRSPPPIAWTSAPTFVGMAASDLPNSTARSPLKVNVAGTAVSTLYCVGPNEAAEMPTAPTSLGPVASFPSLDTHRLVDVTSTMVVMTLDFPSWVLSTSKAWDRTTSERPRPCPENSSPAYRPPAERRPQA